MLQLGNDKTKQVTVTEIKDYYDNEGYIYDIAKHTRNKNYLIMQI